MMTWDEYINPERHKARLKIIVLACMAGAIMMNNGQGDDAILDEIRRICNGDETLVNASAMLLLDMVKRQCNAS